MKEYLFLGGSHCYTTMNISSRLDYVNRPKLESSVEIDFKRAIPFSNAMRDVETYVKRPIKEGYVFAESNHSALTEIDQRVIDIFFKATK